jgi:hypothetical protein
MVRALRGFDWMSGISKLLRQAADQFRHIGFATRQTPVFDFRAGMVPDGVLHHRPPRTNSHRVDYGDYAIGVPIRYTPPLIVGGVLRCGITSKSPNMHCMVRPFGSTDITDGWLSRWAVYDFQFDVQAFGPGIVSTEWAIAFQLWGPYPTNAAWRNPPVSIQVRKNRWRLLLRAGDPRDAAVRELVYDAGPAGMGLASFRLIYRPGHERGLIRLQRDAVDVVSLRGPSMLTHTDQPPHVTFGCYTSRQTAPLGFSFYAMTVFHSSST